MSKTSSAWGRRVAGAAWFALAAAASAELTPQLTAEFRNPWCVTNPGGIYATYYAYGVGSPTYGGSTPTNFLVATNGTTSTVVYAATTGSLKLVYSQFAQPVECQVALYGVGDVIPPPTGLVASNCPLEGFVAVQIGDNTNAYYMSTNPAGTAIWLPSTRQLIAAAGGTVQVNWMTTGGVVQTVYTISSVPQERPSRVFWTESPYNAPPVNLNANGQQVFAWIHYNSYITRPDLQTVLVQNAQGEWVTETQLVHGVWLDGEGVGQVIRATGVEGIALIEYYSDGTYQQSLGVQPIQVMAPSVQFIDADIGSRLLPTDHYYGIDDLIPNITAGLGTDENRVYLVDLDGPKKDWVYAIRRTADNPWDVEIYWQHRDERGVVWPFELDWYAQEWPVDAIRYVLGESETNTAPVLLPSSALTTTLPYEEPANIAAISGSGKSLRMSETGHVLVQYASTDNVWFDVLRAVRHDDETEFDRTPVTWPVGEEMLPYTDGHYALNLSGDNQFVAATMDSSFDMSAGFTVEAWVKRTGRVSERIGPLLARASASGSPLPGEVEVYFGHTNDVHLWTHAGATNWVIPEDGDLNRWHHVAGVYDLTNLLLYVDGELRASLAVSLGLGDPDQPLLIGRSMRQNAFFKGQVDEVRLWNVARTAEQIAENMRRPIREPEEGLAACYPFDEGAGSYIRDVCDGSYGQVFGDAAWVSSFQMTNTGVAEYAQFPGYLYAGASYNVNRYAYPDETEPGRASYLFPVHTNTFEVWWARPGANADLPVPVYYPSLVQCYHSSWPTNAPQIVIASGLGSGSDRLSSPTIYYQNDTNLPGYNPNEEHALVYGGKVYALRDDLNQTNSSARFALVDCYDPDTGRPRMAVYGVVRTNAQYRFEYASIAGTYINPPMPLSAMPYCSNSYAAWGPAWKDRKKSWWAKAAGDDGHVTNAGVRFYYQMQPSFWFPAVAAGSQPPLGSEVPFLPTNSPPVGGGTGGVPLAIRYDLEWPANPPPMAIAQTLTMAKGELPDIWNQLSVDILYQQSVARGQGDSVSLFDPAREHATNLSKTVIEALEAADLARKDLTSPRYILSGLAPSLRERMYWDPNRGLADGQLVLYGKYRETLTGGGYLLPNLLDAADRADALALGAGLESALKTEWETAVKSLPTNITLTVSNQPYVRAALCTALSAKSNAFGYVTLVFNNSTNVQQVPPALPVSLFIIQVGTNLYDGFLDVIESDDALDEKLSLRYAAEFGGRAIDYDFDWRWAEPSGGLPPTSPRDSWKGYESGNTQGVLGVTIEGSSPFTLSDHYFAVRYRRHDGKGPSGTNWSEWVDNFAPGWIQRVMNGINPYEQRIHDMEQNSPNLMLSLVGIAGPPYEGPVALNSAAIDDAGLIQIYQTVMDRAISMSIDAGMVGDDNNNDALLFAASRLSDLYMLLGNEAYADAQDPTLNFGTDSQWYDHYGSTWSSLFCFMNQMPNLLEEELGLLRGRDETFQPSIELSPVYNRLMWNYTRGINGGEVAYALNYNIKGDPTNTTGVISAEDAKAVFPQGHGDAWGHYCSALAGFYRLLAHTNFGWNTIPGGTLVGNASVSSDFYDEQKFAEAAAGKARTGVEIVSRTYRRDYTEPTGERRSFYGDRNTNRAWGVDGWACRAGQGAYLDWVVANSLLTDQATNLPYYRGTNLPPQGIQVIDRTTVPELDEIAVNLAAIQTQLDNADFGLSPLGLDRYAVPFDISPAGIDAGEAHFDQIYERALITLGNAVTAFDYVQGCTLRMREQSESAYALASAAAESEIDYHNRLIEVFGYPYADDIGPGKTFPQGYDGPDLVNYQILDLQDVMGDAPTGRLEVGTRIITVEFEDNSLWNPGDDRYKIDYTYTTNRSTNVSVYLSSEGLKLKDPSWTGRRAAQGEIQIALSSFVQAYYGFLRARESYAGKMANLDMSFDHLRSTAERLSEEWYLESEITQDKKTINDVMISMQVVAELAEITAESAKYCTKGVSRGLPQVVMTVFGGVISDPAGSAMEVSAAVIEYNAKMAIHAAKFASEATKVGLENAILNMELQMATNKIHAELVWSAREFEDRLVEQDIARNELLQQFEAMASAEQQYLAVLRKGERLIAERSRFRNRAAQRLQSDRYADMAFRIFRDEALDRYRATFELASRYCYLAAKAYDYETGLLAGDVAHSPGSRFLSQIVQARSLGRMQDGVPLTAGVQGDPGLADAMARMKADWDVVKGRMGFNNPDTETSRFSLRSELMRISPSSSSDETWRNALATYRVDNLYALTEFQQYCIPFSSTTSREPAIVIPFATWIVPGLNYFGQSLAGGDNAYDSTHGATKIRSVGVWFTGYNITFNTNLTGGGLANQPHVYLVPVGSDVMRSPTRNAGELRTWRVFDQALPLPYNIGQAELDDPDWIPLFDSLSDSFAQRRRHASLRAYHDRGQFDEAETHNNARLVGRSVWNTRWLLIIPGRTLLADPDEAIERFIYGAKVGDSRDGAGIKDIKIFFQTYSIPGE